MSDSVFNPDEFLSSTVEGVGSTSVTPIPQNEYLALIDGGENGVKVVPFQDKTTGEQRLRVDITFNLIDDSGSIRAAIDGRDPRHTQGYFIDCVPGSFRFDNGKGKNVQINKVRDAVGQNDGRPWNVLMLKGAGPLKIKMIVEQDKNDKSIYRNKITAYGKPNG